MILADITLAAPWLAKLHAWLNSLGCTALAERAVNWIAAAVVLGILLAFIVRAYLQPSYPAWLRVVSGLLKFVGIVLLAALLLEPHFTGTRPRPGSNLFLVVADNSKSLQLADRDSRQTRGALMQARLVQTTPWLTRLAQDFDVRRYAFDTTLRPLKDFSELTLDGQASAMQGSLTALAQRFHQHPIAGILLLTDGNATDLEGEVVDWKHLPPVYPVALGAESGLVDLSVARISVSQTNFEAAPVTITAEIEGQDIARRKIVVRVLDEGGKEIERRTLQMERDGEPLAQRFLLRPERPGITFYTVQACLEGEEEVRPGRTAEATLANNRRIATVDRGGGPYRVLYVSGRPNWEFKFLRRAVEEDDEVSLVALVRIAKREPKFTFLGRGGERTNPLFRGFGNQSDEAAEQYDEPVLVRLGTEDKEELRGGFPKDADALFRYHAVILDDIEAEFFKQDQLSLLAQFVSRRGGGLLMLGGKESFGEGGYSRSPVGEMLPVYLDRNIAAAPPAGEYRLRLTREGWLQPWVRLRANEEDETKRLATMPAFKTLNRIDSIKPGASVLAEVESPGGVARPALVVQPFGRGRVGALLISDLWRWNLRRADPKESDLDKAWRQTVRWLVADVPQPVEVETSRATGTALPGAQIVVRARDKQFEPLDNANVTLRVSTPDRHEIELIAESSERAAGTYEATFAPPTAGSYRAQVTVTAPDGSPVGQRETGWSVEPETEEFRTLTVNRPLLARLADETGGEVLSLDGLESFVASLPNRKIPIVESWTYPLWHQWQVFLLAIGCLVGEWGLRRWRGLP
jgi:uncharacterized membrane protein